METIQQMVDRIIADGELTRAEHQEFLARVNADEEIDPEEKEQIERLFDLIVKKKLKIVK